MLTNPAVTAPVPPTTGAGLPANPGATGSIADLLASFSGTSAPSTPQVPYPAQQSQMNPAFLQMIMQAAAAGQGSAQSSPTLGAILGGR